MEPPLRREHRGLVGRDGLRAVQRVGRVGQPADRRQVAAEADERVDILRRHRDDRAIHVDRTLGTAHQPVQPRDPQSRLEIVRVRGRDRLELLERAGVLAAARQAFRLGALIGGLRLRRGDERQGE